MIARINPRTGDIENIEVLFFSTRLLRDDMFEVPLGIAESIDRHSNERPKSI